MVEHKDTYYSAECPPKVGDTVFYYTGNSYELAPTKVTKVYDNGMFEWVLNGLTRTATWDGRRFIREDIHDEAPSQHHPNPLD